MTGPAVLTDEICREIVRAGGRITFARFMELALYHPQHGYYTSGRCRIGKTGDYFTSVSVGPLFGKILARQFRQWREEFGSKFEVVEFGGQHGQLRRDVLAAAPDLHYRVVELGDPLPSTITGCVFSNEFLDALPVHRVRVVGGAWHEEYVGLAPSLSPSSGANCQAAGTALAGQLGRLSDRRLAEYLRGLPADLMEGYRSEINLRALDWLADITRRLKRGYILTIDYGFDRAEYFAPHHRAGHLQCYYQHTKNDNAYEHVGEQDITAHVEFGALIECGRQLGLELVLFTDQARYLLDVGASEIAEIVQRTAGQLSSERAAIHQLLHSTMGRAFSVLVLKTTA